MGVGLFRHVMRRGPFALLSPTLRLPTHPTAQDLHDLEQRMRDAETAHALLFVLMSGWALHGAIRGLVGHRRLDVASSTVSSTAIPFSCSATTEPAWAVRAACSEGSTAD